jgi:hypothetical protein
MKKQGCVMTTYTDNECNNYTVGLALVGLYKGGLFVLKKTCGFALTKADCFAFIKAVCFVFKKTVCSLLKKRLGRFEKSGLF